jgi:uncharacterized lipoprotein YajG
MFFLLKEWNAMNIKKYTRVLAVIIVLLCSSFISAFGVREAESDILVVDNQQIVKENTALVTITGHINVYGSMPHTYLGIVTEDKKVYTVLADKDVLSQLQKTQGKSVALTGIIISRDENSTKMLFQTLKNGQFKLKSWKILENK